MVDPEHTLSIHQSTCLSLSISFKKSFITLGPGKLFYLWNKYCSLPVWILCRSWLCLPLIPKDVSLIPVSSRGFPEEPIRGVFNDSSEISFLFLDKNMCYWYSLESPRWGGSNKYQQRRFYSRIVENYPQIIIKYPSYLFLWFSHIQSLSHC